MIYILIDFDLRFIIYSIGCQNIFLNRQLRENVKYAMFLKDI